MREVFTEADNIITPLGTGTTANFDAIRGGASAIRVWDDQELYPGPVALSRFDSAWLDHSFNDRFDKSMKTGPFTRLEKMFILSVSDALSHSTVKINDPRTLLVISTTKGNIDLLEQGRAENFDGDRIFLWRMAETIRDFFGNPNKPLVVCNACISGSLAIIMAARLIRSGRYDHAVVTGGDIVTEFVVSGFQSFQALSAGQCKPFDAARDGLNLGEGCATLVLSAMNPEPKDVTVRIAGGSTSNDANHISGPSRDGRGLFLSIEAAMREAGLEAKQIGYISAHGTATSYNDEMESLALSLAGMDKIPVNSFKGSIGHTLGAAGVIESVLAIRSMTDGWLLGSAGYTSHGVSSPINVIRESRKENFDAVLKTASGFGGCNASVVFIRKTGRKLLKDQQA